MLTAGAQAVKLGIGFASVIVLGCLLQPCDSGVYAMAAPFVEIVLLVQDFGLSQALVVTLNVDERLAAGIFRLNVAVSAGLALVLPAFIRLDVCRR